MLIKSKVINSFNFYEVVIESGNLSKAGFLIQKKTSPSQIFVLTNPKIYRLYFEKLKKSISKQGWKIYPIIIPEGERFKNFNTYQKVFGKLMDVFAPR